MKYKNLWLALSLAGMSVISDAEPMCKGSYITKGCTRLASKAKCQRHYTFNSCNGDYPGNGYIQCYWLDGTCREKTPSVHHCTAAEKDQKDIKNKNRDRNVCKGGGWE